MFPFPFSSRANNDSDRYTSWGKKRTSRTGGLPSSETSTPRHTWGSQTSSADSLKSTASSAAWPGNSLISPPLTAQLFTRPPSSPTHSPVGPSRANKVYKHSSLQTIHNQPIKLEPHIASGSDDGYFSTAGSKQLSPIVEQDYFSPEGRPMSLPVDHPTELQICTPNGTEFSDTPRPSPVYSTFLTRPLKRSISQMSQTSSRTHLSTVTSPPNIPPLDLRPAFSGPLDSPPLRTPTRLAATPAFPSIAGAIQEFSPGCDDASSLHADSFISAQTAGQLDRNPYSQAEQGSVRSNTTRSIPDSRSASSFVGRRWTASLSFGSDLLLLSKSRDSHSRLGMAPARMLFWLGFVAPWCWLIGGWMLTRSGETKGEGGVNSVGPLMLLPLWKKGSDKGITGGKGKDSEGALAAGKQGYGFGYGYPFVVPSVESLTPSVKMLRTKTPGDTKPLDPWVKRCRVAAVISGILILIALVVAIIVTREYHRQGSAGA